MNLVGLPISLLFVGFFAASPSSTNYTLKAFDFGNGGGQTSSTNYKLNGITNGQTSNAITSSSYIAQPGIASTVNANVPVAPTFDNPNNYYDRLHLVIATSNNPSNTKYAVAISDDNFVTTNYVKSDNTTGSSLSLANFQTYALWGGAAGFNITGLKPNTAYKAKVTALNGNFSQTSFGPIASASTQNPSISFAVSTSLSATPPFETVFTSLAPGTVFNANADTQLALTTNAVFGGKIYTNDLYAGLKSFTANYTLASGSANLSSAQRGYGAQVVSTSQSDGGPISAVAPYNGNSDNIGGLTVALQPILATPAPITSAQASVRLKAKADVSVPSANDYTDNITYTAAMSF